jgi:hypothetical protein
MRALPTGLAARVCSLLGLKIPTAPGTLAATLLMISGSSSKELEEQVLKINQGNADFEVSAFQRRAQDILVELLCGFSWLALSILSRDEYRAEPNLFQVYTLRTFEQLENLLEDEQLVAHFRQIGEETRELYLYDRPTLRELAATNGVAGYFEEVIGRSEREQNWFGTYILKAEIRIASKLPVSFRSIYYLSCAYAIGFLFLTSVDAFRRLRPVLVEPFAKSA